MELPVKVSQILKVAVRGGASDILLKVGSVPRFRHHGSLVSLSDGRPISSEQMVQWIKDIIPEKLAGSFESKTEIDFAYELDTGSRFRVNVFKQRGHFGMVLRVIPNHVSSIEELRLPEVFNKFITYKQGLILVTGATGSGKSTTLAAMIQSLNGQKPVHVITIEDPIESVFQDQVATINQREVGIDTPNFSTALRAALRQNPDIILVGELRDKETIETTLMAAETGHLVLSTLHTHDAVDSLNRIMSYFEPHQHTMIKSQLATTLQAVVSQRLVPRADGRSLAPALEIMVVNQFIRECIMSEGSRFTDIHDAIKRGDASQGMQSFDQSLLQLANEGVITREHALRFASSPSDIRRLLDGVSD